MLELSVSPMTAVVIVTVNATTSITHVTSNGIVTYDKPRSLDWLANLFKLRQFSISSEQEINTPNFNKTRSVVSSGGLALKQLSFGAKGHRFDPSKTSKPFQRKYSGWLITLNGA